MKKKLVWSQYLYIGSMLFGLFFGAGNLIFPVHMGQEAGANVLLANLGFLSTAIGLPLLGIIAIAVSGSYGVFDLASRVSRRFSLIFTVLLYLTIGPFFALPRLATTSFEIGLVPFISKDSQALFLALFSVVFFLIAWFFSRKPSKLLDYVGKFLNPLFLILLAALIILAFIRPLGGISNATISSSYLHNPFFKGFTEGYNTLDTLSAIAFGIIIVSTIKNMGIEEPKDIARDTIKSGTISIILMGVIYTLLSIIGTMSLGSFAVSENGGITLAQIANYYLGVPGSVLLAFIVILACLKTAIGIITSFSGTFVELFPKRSYRFYIAVVSILPCLFANVGLTNIIQFSTPVLMFIYPLAMTLILVVLLGPLFKHKRAVYSFTIYFTMIAALLDALNNTPESIKQTSFVSTILDAASNYLPLFSMGMGWVVPAAVGFICGLIYTKVKKV